MKSDLMGRVDEWIGIDVPGEGAEDYESWQSKLSEIEAIQSIQDVIDYVHGEGFDLEGFFVGGRYDVISAGLNPGDVPSGLIFEAGELIAQSTSDGLWVNVYLFDGKYFVVNAAETKIADARADAIRIAGIDNDSSDQIIGAYTCPTSSDSIDSESPKEKPAIKTCELKRRAVLIVVTDWPGGTMAFKFGDAMRAALGVTREGMNLVQMSPERIFRVETMVTEAEFREAMRLRQVASGGCVLFVDIPEN